MKRSHRTLIPLIVIIAWLAGACQPKPNIPAVASNSLPPALAVETYLADIAQNVAGDRMKVESLMPLGMDPHAYEPTPGEVARIADSRVLIVNGAGVEEWLQRTLDNAGGTSEVIDASAGLQGRNAREGEAVKGDADGHEQTIDPHFWLDPISVVHYVENIRDGLTRADPPGKDTYTANATAYIAHLQELDAWIKNQVTQVPPEKRLLVTNHESFGYFADRYGFTIAGSIIPSVSSGASPSAKQLASLADHVKSAGVRAIFLETGSNPQLAQQIARETGLPVAPELLSHSITAPDGPAPTYIDMMKYNTLVIVDALK